MPVEARTSEPWYGYQSGLGFDYTATVEPGRLYPDPLMHPDQLHRTRVPVDPPVYRRVLISQLTDSIHIDVPYYFRADRSAKLKLRMVVDGQLVMPGLWEQPRTFVSEKTWETTTNEVSGTERFDLSIQQFLSDMEATHKQLNFGGEPLEIHLKPTFEVTVEGLKEPLQVINSTAYQAVLRTTTLEIDEPRENKLEKNLAEVKVIPIMVSFFGAQVRVALLRQISTYALIAFLLLAAAMVLLRRRKPDSRGLLQRLGPNLLPVRSFELPGDTAIAEVRSAKELIQLQAQTERPVIKVDNTYYLLDGTTCYRYVIAPSEQPAEEPGEKPEAKDS